MLKRIISIVLLVFVTFGVLVNASAANRYQRIASNNELTVLYDTKSVEYHSNDGKTVDVWIMWQYTEDGARKFVKGNREDGYWLEKKWDKFSYSKQRWVLSKDSYKLLQFVNYDVNDNVLNSYTNQNAEWRYFTPDTMGEAVHETFIWFLKG